MQPKIILVLGSVALEQLLGVKGITRLRGTEMKWQDQIPAIPTFHPAYLLRSPANAKRSPRTRKKAPSSSARSSRTSHLA